MEKSDTEWKELLGDFGTCSFCDATVLKTCNCLTCKKKDVKDKGLTCGEHHMDHKYLIALQREKYTRHYADNQTKKSS